MGNTQSKGMKTVSVILGFFLGGMLWRCRGESGFGSSWGLYSVGLVLMLLIYVFYGKKPGMKWEMVPFGAFLLGLGVTGYATVIEQPAGVLSSCVPYMEAEEAYLPVNATSGLIIFMIMGFTFVPFFSFFIGSLFSEKQYKLKDYIAIIVLFFASSYVFKATLAHPIMSIINPDQIDLAKAGLEYSGFDYSSPAIAYLKHFGDRNWAEDIPFFENYYMSVEHISDFLATVTCILFVRLKFKDKITALAGLVINLYTSIATTLCVSMVIYPFGTGFAKYLEPFKNILSHTDWGIWEYATGASVGLITMLFIALLPKKYTAQSKCDMGPVSDNPVLNFAADTVLATFILALTPARAIGLRIGKVLQYSGVIENYHSVGDTLMIGLTVVMTIGFILMFKKNFFDRGVNSMGVDPVKFSQTALPAYVIMCFVLYLFTNRAPAIVFPYDEISSALTFFECLFSLQYVDVALVIISTLIFVIAFPIIKKKKQ